MIAVLEIPLHQAVPYVAAAYTAFFALILLYLAIMAGKLSRIERELGELTRTGGAPAGERRGAGRAVTELLLLGISHRIAPVALRERVALTERQGARFVDRAVQRTGDQRGGRDLDLQPDRAVRRARRLGRRRGAHAARAARRACRDPG